MGEWIDIAADDGGTFQGYLAVPDEGLAPGIVLIQEIFGVNESIRAVADGFAKDGFAVLAPDLFWRLEPRIELGFSEKETEQARELMGRFDIDQGVKDIAAAGAALRGQGGCSGEVAVVGFCLGGRMAYLAAARLDIDAAVAFYGVRIHEYLDEAENVVSPIMFHFGEEDPAVPLETLAPIRDAFAGRRDVTFHIYQGAGHAFYNRFRDSYREKAAQLAHDRTVQFLKHSLEL